MNNQFDCDREEELRRERWQQRMAEMKRQKERREMLNRNIKKYAGIGCAILAVVFIGVGSCIHIWGNKAEPQNEVTKQEGEKLSLENIPEEQVAKSALVEKATSETKESVTTESAAPALVESISGEDSENNKNTVVATEEEESVQTTEPIEETAEEEEKTAVTLFTDAAIVPQTVMTAPKQEAEIPVGEVVFWSGYQAETTDATRTINAEDVVSEYGILLNAANGTIVAQKAAKTIINPASMTKVLTVLVAAEHVTNLDDEFTMTLEITDYAYVNDCSSVGFLDGEKVTVRDLFYGTILPSGGDAAVALATYVAGSHEAFVEMMNEKLEELGISETAHFTNCVGLYDEEHYCTVYDMAMIMKAAAENDLCREVMSARKYTTSPTEQHPEGITVSNWFLRRIEDKETGGEVLCAKTGYVNQSGSCAASYAISDGGVPYICVTAKSTSSWNCIYDHVALYSEYTADNRDYD